MKAVLPIVVFAVVLLAIGGCGKTDQMIAHYTGTASICHEGVQYIQFTSGATVAYNTNGSIKLCK